MPIDVADLQSALRAAIQAYNADRNQAVRGGQFISPIHDYCARELARHGLSPDNLVPNLTGGGYLPSRSNVILEATRQKIRSRLRSEATAEIREQLIQDVDRIEADARRRRLRVLGGYMQKEIDVCYMVEDTGPLLAISVKSQMTSIAKNAINRFEEYVGDATNLHTRYPLLALGFLLVVPTGADTFDTNTGQPRELLLRIHALLEQATGRDPNGSAGSYEASALLVVDFDADPPTIHPDYPPADSPLRIEHFFDRLVDAYSRRNRPLM